MRLNPPDTSSAVYCLTARLGFAPSDRLALLCPFFEHPIDVVYKQMCAPVYGRLASCRVLSLITPINETHQVVHQRGAGKLLYDAVLLQHGSQSVQLSARFFDVGIDLWVG
jgi:hypothetical protein